MANYIRFIPVVLLLLNVSSKADDDSWVSDAVYKCGDGYVVSFHQSNVTNDVVLLQHDRLISKYSPPYQQTVSTLEGDLVSSTMLTDITGLEGKTVQQQSAVLATRLSIAFVYERRQHEPWNERTGLIIDKLGQQKVITCKKSN